ncbi:hypothetical protein OsI_12485 [Oryza sativa Indica Group]|uniref:Uncharacterized protein n=1 Tax=Oryza sativa subsp. indica TaxID=39946 RepID=B8ALP7_ORYSI|nr:hypothetical protein OsI_12485 [Oryza sativa Indica Group]
MTRGDEAGVEDADVSRRRPQCAGRRPMTRGDEAGVEAGAVWWRAYHGGSTTRLGRCSGKASTVEGRRTGDGGALGVVFLVGDIVLKIPIP